MSENTRRPLSLSQRLLLVGGIGLLLVSVVASLLATRLYENSLRQQLDEQLQQDLASVLAMARIDEHGQLQLAAQRGDARHERVFSGAYWQITDLQGGPLAHSRSLWDASLPLPAADTPPRQGRHLDLDGPLDQPLRGYLQQVQLARADAPVLVLSARDRSALDVQVATFQRNTGLGLAGLIALWLGVLASQVYFGLRPLRLLGRQVEQVRQGQASRIDERGLGRDVLPLSGELNALLDHHQRMVERARRSAQDLAHALKTPLAVLAAEIHGDGRHWQQTVEEQTQRMQASITRYLASGLVSDHRQRTPVSEVIQSLLPLMQRIHGGRGIAFQADAIAPQAVFAGERSDLEEMLGNLLDNAGKWAQREVRLQLTLEQGQLLIDIEDDGPGLPDDALESVIQRGVRLDQRASSSGLGLAIVDELARSHAGTLQLSNRQPAGLRARLVLPAA